MAPSSLCHLSRWYSQPWLHLSIRQRITPGLFSASVSIRRRRHGWIDSPSKEEGSTDLSVGRGRFQIGSARESRTGRVTKRPPCFCRCSRKRRWAQIQLMPLVHRRIRSMRPKTSSSKDPHGSRPRICAVFRLGTGTLGRPASITQTSRTRQEWKRGLYSASRARLVTPTEQGQPGF